MPRVNVYVSDDLKRRMDESKSDGLNWSAIASQAFEAKLAELIGRKGAKDMRDVVNRLKASKAKSDSEMKTAGHMAGIDWAQRAAEAIELQRLEACMQGPHWPDAVRFTGDRDADALGFYFSLVSPEGGHSQDAYSFWWKWSGNDEEMPGPEFMEGFAEGAMEVWEMVKEEL